MKYDESTQNKIQIAISKIQQLKQFKDGIHQIGIDKEKADSIINMLTVVEQKSNDLLYFADAHARDLSSKVILEVHKSPRASSSGSTLGSLISGAIGGVTNSASQIVQSATPIASSILNTTKNVADTLTTTATNVSMTIGNCAVDVAGNIVDSAAKTANSIIGNTSKLVGDITNQTSSFINGISGSTNSTNSTNAIDTIFQNVSNLSDGTSKTVAGLISSAKDISNSLIGESSKLSSNLVSNASQACGSIINSATNAIGSLIGSSNASGLIGNIFGGSSSPQQGDVGGLIGSISNSLSSGVIDAGQAGGQLISGIGSNVAGLSNSIMGSTSDVVGSMVDSAMSVVGNIIDSSSAVGGNILDAAGGVASSIVNTTSDIGTNLLGSVQGIAQDTLSMGGSAIENLSNFVQDSIGTAADIGGELISTAQNIAEGVVDMASDIASGLMDTAADIASNIMDTANDMVDSLMSDSTDAVENIVDNIETSMDDIGNSIEEMNQQFEPPSDELDSDEEDNESYEDYDDEWIYWEDYDDEDDDEDDGTNPNGEGNDGKPPFDQPKKSDPTSSSTTPTGNDSKLSDNSITTKGDKKDNSGWTSHEFEVETGVIAMMRDGDQQALNPYGPKNSWWTRYSFRPADTDGAKGKKYPKIAITPSSFNILGSLETMLDNIPFVVIKEYFFKNTASTMQNFVKKLMGSVNEAKTSPTSNAPNASSKGSGDAKSTGNSLMEKIKDVFNGATLQDTAIDLPYILYAGLRAKLYGNTYVFPYLVDEGGGTMINNSSNEQEWGKGSGGLIESLKDMVSNVAGMLGGLAADAMGSQAKGADLFPAPTWGGPNANTDRVSFSFDLMLINDDIMHARNNYMCVNTIIHNNRYIQKAILTFPGALYEVWLPTGQRHLMCTGDFKLYPLGLNRKVPEGFFDGHDGQPDIGADGGERAQMKQKHNDKQEVIPDGYKLSCTFKSCLANNMNTAVFQYYVQMTEYDPGSTAPPGKPSSTMESKLESHQPAQVPQEPPPTGAAAAAVAEAQRDASMMSRSLGDILFIRDGDIDYIEKFDESTYNKRLATLRSQFGDQSINSDSVITVVRKSQTIISESSEFLSKLYNANKNNLWYKQDTTEELYTTIKPDYKQILRKKYGQKFKQLTAIERKIEKIKEKLKSITYDLSNITVLDDRDELLETRMTLNNNLGSLLKKKDDVSSELIQMDTEMIQKSFDDYDSTISVKKNPLTANIFKQVWNEKIMNSYEKEKLQYMTSYEKERYFQDKIIELSKYDTYHILNHQDWFFRVAVLDFVVYEMRRLILWFKSCTYGDFETIYKIVRKLKLLMLDIDQIRAENDKFEVNKSNLFFITDEEMENFTKIDDMLTGNTLYELFKSQSIVKVKPIQDDSKIEIDFTKNEKIEIAQEQKTEVDIAKRKSYRQDIVQRYWGSESELTKAAYDLVNEWDYDGEDVFVNGEKYPGGIKALKDNIITLKLTNSNSEELRDLLGAFTNAIASVKEKLVMDKMTESNNVANDIISTKDDNVNAQVIEHYQMKDY